jgi:hypothetical protein
MGVDECVNKVSRYFSDEADAPQEQLRRLGFPITPSEEAEISKYLNEGGWI